MKKILIVLTTVFVSNIACAQFHFGLKVAPTVAWMKANVKELKNDGLRAGFSYGLITEFGLTKNYAFGTGVDITYRGGKMTGSYSQDSTMYTSENTYKFQFIEIPLTLKMKTNPIGPMTYFGQIGVAPGFAINTKGDLSTAFDQLQDTVQQYGNTVANEDIEDVVNKFLVSMIISAGAEYNVGGSTNLLVAITFNNGFTNLLKEAAEDYNKSSNTTLNKKYEYVQKASSNYIALTLGVLF